MYLIASRVETDTAPRESIPEGLWRPPDGDYLKSGRQPPSNWEIHMAARIRVRADRKLKRSTPQWILDWAHHPSFGGWK